jgi:hypothetical protein
MACERYRDTLSKVAAGGAAPAAFDAHLPGCDDCRAGLALLRQVLTIADQDLQQVAASEPSAGFVSRIRAAVKESGSAPAWRAGWLWPSLATAAALVLTIAIFVKRAADEVTAPTMAAAPEAQPASVPAPASVRVPTVAVAKDSGHAALPTQRRTPPRQLRAEPQVLVPPGESRALVQLIALVNRERLSPAALVAAEDTGARLTTPAPIEIKSIEIVPLDTAHNPGT